MEPVIVPLLRSTSKEAQQNMEKIHISGSSRPSLASSLLNTVESWYETVLSTFSGTRPLSSSSRGPSSSASRRHRETKEDRNLEEEEEEEMGEREEEEEEEEEEKVGGKKEEKKKTSGFSTKRLFDDDGNAVGNSNEKRKSKRNRNGAGKKKMRKTTRKSVLSGPVRGFAWHPQVNRWAVGLSDDTVCFYDVATNDWESLVLAHEYQKDIRQVKFNPVGGYSIAVGCEEGVCLWRLVSTNRRSAWMTWLHRDGDSSLSQLDFSPCGRYIAAGFRSSSSLLVWEVAKAPSAPMRIFVRGGADVVKWCPSGDFLFVSNQHGDFQTYNTRTWTSNTWKTRSVRVVCDV